MGWNEFPGKKACSYTSSVLTSPFTDDYYPFLVFQAGSHEAVTRKLKYQKRLEAPWEDAEGMGSAGGALLSPPGWRLRCRQKEDNRQIK